MWMLQQQNRLYIYNKIFKITWVSVFCNVNQPPTWVIMICEELVCLYIYLYNFYVFWKILSRQIFQEGKILKQAKSIEILSGSFWYLDYWWIWYRIISNYMKLFCMKSTPIVCNELGTKTCNKFSGHSPVVKVWIHLWLCILVERLAKITKGLWYSSNQQLKT